MTRAKRPNGAGQIYVKHGSYYGRWATAGRGRANRKLGPVRRPGTATGLTKGQAERRLRELMASIEVTTDPERTLVVLGEALLGQLEQRGRARSHLQTVESHLRVHIYPCFGDRPVDRINEDQVMQFYARLRKRGLAPKTVRNVGSTLHSLFALAIRRRWIVENPCTLVDLPAVRANADIRYLTHEELLAVLERGVPAGRLQLLDRALSLTAAMTGLRQGELLGLRWDDVDLNARKLRVRQSYVRGELKGPKSVRGSRGVPLAGEVAMALESLRERCGANGLVFGDPTRERRWIATTSEGDFNAHADAPAFAWCGSTICGTPSGRASPRWGRSPSERCRSGWAIATPRRRSSTPTTNPVTERPRSSAGPSISAPGPDRAASREPRSRR